MATYTPDYTIDIVTAKFAGNVVPFFRINIDVPNLAYGDKLNFGNLASNLLRFEGTISVSGLFGVRAGYNVLSSLGFRNSVIQCDDNSNINLRVNRVENTSVNPNYIYVNAYLRNSTHDNRNFGIGGVFNGSRHSGNFGYSPFMLVYNKSVNKYITFGHYNGDVGVGIESVNNPGFVNNNNIPVSYIYTSEYVETLIGDRTVSYLDEYDIFTPWVTDPYNPGGESEKGGGTGDFDGTSDPIDFPSLPILSAVDTGFITLFNPSLSELQALAAYMWNNSLFDISNFQKLFADPMDAILGLSIVPVTIPNAGAQPIKVGNIATNVSMNKAATQYIEVDCGTLNVNEYWGAYLDYAPYTKAEIYLPYCGAHAIDIDDIMNKSVHVKYHVDILSGACCAYVKCGDSVLYQFSGQCSSSIPISGTDFTQMVNGVLSAAVSIGSMVATGGASAPLAVPALANTAVNGMKPSIEKSGAISGTSGMLAIQKPYMILTRPKQALPFNQNKYTGYPSYVTVTLADISGYTEVENIHLEGVSGTDSEIDEIITLLRGGVIL